MASPRFLDGRVTRGGSLMLVRCKNRSDSRSEVTVSLSLPVSLFVFPIPSRQKVARTWSVLNHA
jgi:hypothetical protein